MGTISEYTNTDEARKITEDWTKEYTYRKKSGDDTEADHEGTGGTHYGDHEIVACLDMPEIEPRYKSHEDVPMSKVYRNARWPSKPARRLAEEAFGVLRDLKGLKVDHVRVWGDVGYGTNGSGELTLAYSITDDRMIATHDLAVRIPQRTFDRARHDIDAAARLRGRMPTDTYIMLRLAFVLGEAYRLNDSDARNLRSDLIYIDRHNTTLKYDH